MERSRGKERVIKKREGVFIYSMLWYILYILHLEFEYVVYLALGKCCLILQWYFLSNCFKNYFTAPDTHGNFLNCPLWFNQERCFCAKAVRIRLIYIVSGIASILRKYCVNLTVLSECWNPCFLVLFFGEYCADTQN